MLCDECRVNDILDGAEYCVECRKKTKECKKCHEVKSIYEFEKNQRTVKGVRSRRSECIPCRKGKKAIPAKARREFEKNNPRTAMGDTFQCPICEKMFTVANKNDVNLDHDNETGEIRGWVCGSCNTSMGRLNDDVSTLARAILWIKDKGKTFLFM